PRALRAFAGRRRARGPRGGRPDRPPRAARPGLTARAVFAAAPAPYINSMATTIPPDHPAPADALSRALTAALTRLGHDVGRPVAVACLGTDRSTGDALGPLAGEGLLRLGADPALVIGTLENPLHALNLEARLGPLYARRPRPLIVAIDAALG